MNLYLNKTEIAEHVAIQILRKRMNKISIEWTSTDRYIQKAKKKIYKTGLIDIDQINNVLRQDLEAHRTNIVSFFKKNFRPLCAWLAERLDQFDSDTLTKICEFSTRSSFVKTLGKNFPNSYIVVNSACIDYSQPTLIRNTVNNELIIQKLLSEQKEFWFVDSGYTNFLYAKGKPWHRLVHNHIHYNPQLDYFPADRLSQLPSWPKPWKKTGNKILVAQSSDMYYRSQGIDPEMWCDRIRTTLAKYTDRPIEFKIKPDNRKTRITVYDLLQSSDDYYCVVSDASAAAVEAIWCGVPVITLQSHITTPVARTQLADIENLYRGPIGNWLCALTYSQFSYEELCNGTALEIIEKYHA